MAKQSWKTGINIKDYEQHLNENPLERIEDTVIPENIRLFGTWLRKKFPMTFIKKYWEYVKQNTVIEGGVDGLN